MPDVVEDGAFAAAAAATFADDVVDVAVAVTVAAFGRAEGDDGDAARTRAVRRGAGLLLRRREARLANSCTPIRDPRRLLCPRFDAAFGLVSRPCGTPPS